MRLTSVLIWLVLLLQGARADTLALSGDWFWAVLASRQDLDQAVAVALAQRESNTFVVRSANGWFAAISGPHQVQAGQGRGFLDDLIKRHGAPKDAYLTHGANFEATAWTPPKTNVSATISYDGEHDVSWRRGDLILNLSRRAAGDDQFNPTLKATYKGKPAFDVAIADNSAEKPASAVSLVRLDPSSPVEQVVFTYFWQGAHCCSVTRIATMAPDGSWQVVDGGALDGGGYNYEDLGGSGWSYLASSDQAFLYAFDSYADSVAPIQIKRLQGTSLLDVTRDPELRHRVLQDLYAHEFWAGSSGEADTRQSHGFLAGWVADAILAGRGEQAWATMLATYSREDSMFGPETCSIDRPIATCPDDKKVMMPFPDGLRLFLTEHGYIVDPSRFAVPGDAKPVRAVSGEASTPDMPPQLQTCSNAGGTVRKLVYQTFAGRKLLPDEATDAVTLQDDTTLEAYDPVLRRVTCAVTYDIVLRPLIGRLAKDGDLARAETLSRMSRRSGGKASSRVRYTVKPTATPGSEYVELMP